MPQIQLPGFDNTSLSSKKLDPGRYQVNITDVPQVKTSDNGKNFIEVEFTVRTGPKQEPTNPNEQPQDPTGMKISDRLYYDNEKAWYRIKGLMVSAGILARDDTESPKAKGQIDLDEWAGATLTIDVVSEMRDGKDYRNVNYVV